MKWAVLHCLCTLSYCLVCWSITVFLLSLTEVAKDMACHMDFLALVGCSSIPYYASWIGVLSSVQSAQLMLWKIHGYFFEFLENAQLAVFWNTSWLWCSAEACSKLCGRVKGYKTDGMEKGKNCSLHNHNPAYIDGSIWLSLLLKRGQSLFICYEAECSLWKTIEEGDSVSGSSPRKGPSIRSHVQCITTCLQIWNRYGILHWIDLWKIDDRCEKTVDGEKSVGEYGCFAVKEIAEWSARISKLLVHGYSFSPGPAPRVDCVGGVEPSFADWSWNWHWICRLQLNSTQRIDNDLKKSTAFFRQLFANFLQILPTVMRSRGGVSHPPPPHTLRSARPVFRTLID